MRNLFAENMHQALVDVLLAELRRTSEAKFAVAFVTRSGLQLIEKELQRCLERGAHLEFLVGLDFETTDGKALRWLRETAGQTSKLSFYCFRDPIKDEGPTFHPKLYFLRRRSYATVIIGSSNLTRRGMKENVELNVIMRDCYDSETVSAVLGIYADFRFRGNLFTPDEDYIEDYERAATHMRKSRGRTLLSKPFAKMIASLEKKEASLPKPTIRDPSTLTGWQKLVYEKIPPREFTTESMYQFVEEFREAYPRNRHIEDKIRQVLQQLRDDGIVKHLGRGRWIRRAD